MNNTCKVYKSCAHVPCNSGMNKCKPEYCVPGSSSNWSLCNMSNWGKDYKKYNKFCYNESKCKFQKTKKQKNKVDALLLHKKMPYIWRHLKPNTRKHMIELAKKPIEKINIPFHVFHDKKHKKSLKRMSKKERKLYFSLKKKYKNI